MTLGAVETLPDVSSVLAGDVRLASDESESNAKAGSQAAMLSSQRRPWTNEELDKLDDGIIRVALQRRSEGCADGLDITFGFMNFAAVSEMVGSRSSMQCFLRVANAFHRALAWEQQELLSSTGASWSSRSAVDAAEACGRQHSLRWLDSEVARLNTALRELGFRAKDVIKDVKETKNRLMDVHVFKKIVEHVGTRSPQMVGLRLGHFCGIDAGRGAEDVVGSTSFNREHEVKSLNCGTCETVSPAQDGPAKTNGETGVEGREYPRLEPPMKNCEDNNIHNWSREELDRLDAGLLKLAEKRLEGRVSGFFEAGLSLDNYISVSHLVGTRSAAQCRNRVVYSRQWGLAWERLFSKTNISPKSSSAWTCPRQHSLNWLPGEVTRFQSFVKRISTKSLVEGTVDAIVDFVGTRSAKMIRFQLEHLDIWGRLESSESRLPVQDAHSGTSPFGKSPSPRSTPQSTRRCPNQQRSVRPLWKPDELDRLDAGVLKIAETRLEEVTATGFGCVIRADDGIPLSQVVRTRNPGQCLSRIYTSRQKGLNWEKKFNNTAASDGNKVSPGCCVKGAPGCSRQHSLDWLPGEVSRLEAALQHVPNKNRNDAAIRDVVDFVSTRSAAMVRFQLVLFYGWDPEVLFEVPFGDSSLDCGHKVSAPSVSETPELVPVTTVPQQLEKGLSVQETNHGRISALSVPKERQLVPTTNAPPSRSEPGLQKIYGPFTETELALVQSAYDEMLAPGKSGNLFLCSKILAPSIPSRSRKQIYMKLYCMRKNMMKKRLRDGSPPSLDDKKSGKARNVEPVPIAGESSQCHDVRNALDDEPPSKRRHFLPLPAVEKSGTVANAASSPHGDEDGFQGCVLAGHGDGKVVVVCLHSNCPLPPSDPVSPVLARQVAKTHASSEAHLRCVREDVPSDRPEN